jgi:hypothetical protein
LRNVGLSGEAVAIKDLRLVRDAGTFLLRSGTICFVNPVNGKVTGAVFTGEGTFILDPPIEMERNSLKLLTKQDEFVEKFEHLALRFTDGTYEELKKAGTPATTGCNADPLKASQHATRHQLRYNLDARILQDVLSPDPGGLFVAFVDGRNYSDRMLYAIDPHGVPEFAEELVADQRLHTRIPIAIPLAPEEVVLMTYGELKYGYWSAFHLSPEYKTGEARGNQKNSVITIDSQKLDTTLDKKGNLQGRAITSCVAKVNNLRVVPFDLYRTLRVESVTSESGEQLSFIQEDKNQDFQFFVVLPKSLSAGEKFVITTVYGGKDAVSEEGAGNYYPIARENWYPAGSQALMGEFATYDMTFHVPHGLQMAATGALVSSSHDGPQEITVWKSEAPQTVAGFSFGRFKLNEAKLEKPQYLVQAFANEDVPESVWHRQVVSGATTMGTMATTLLNEKALAEGELAVDLYSDYFGPSLFKRLELTQQTSCDYGQSWPGLVWIPMCYYYDTTVRHQLGLDFGDRGYWKIVTPHEVAHQWWGHTVGFASYRDQWMSEGFADMSASLYLTLIEKNPKKFITFWNDEREFLLEKDSYGFRPIDAGPLTMGYRLSNSRTGAQITRRLIYPKGAYVLHMLRMMMHDGKTGDQRFKEMMREFVKTYTGKSATTEDFKAMVEKYMTRDMDFNSNHKMDWFFNEYVYGTQLPQYKLDQAFETAADGTLLLNIKVTESRVDDSFRMLVPVYLEMEGGDVMFLGRARIGGNMSIETKMPLKGLQGKPKRALINYYDDVLAYPN